MLYCKQSDKCELLNSKITAGFFTVTPQVNTDYEVNSNTVTHGSLPTSINAVFSVIGQSNTNIHTTTFHYDDQLSHKLYCVTNVSQSYSVRWFQFD